MAGMSGTLVGASGETGVDMGKSENVGMKLIVMAGFIPAIHVFLTVDG
jgi:hypothetical protein